MNSPEVHPATAMRIRCANCNAAPGEPCTQPDKNGRHAVRWVHYIRADHALWPPDEPAVQA